MTDCGASQPGKCPYVDSGNNYTLETNVANKLTIYTPAPLKEGGCLYPDVMSPCRFSAEANDDVLIASILPEQDDANGGARNELSNFRENFGEEGLIVVDGLDRYYSITVQVPVATSEFPPMPPFQSGSQAWGHIFWQMHEVGECSGGGPMLMLGLRRTDTTTSQQAGADYQFVMWEKPSYGGAVTRRWPAGRNTIGITRGVEYTFTIHRRWSTGEDGFTRLWINGEPVPLSAGSGTTLYRWPKSTNACADDLSNQYFVSEGVMPAYLKIGMYSDPNLAGRHSLRIWNVRHGATCASIWSHGGVPCP